METKPFTRTSPVFALFVFLCKQTTLQDKGIRRKGIALPLPVLLSFANQFKKKYHCKTLKT